MISIIVSSINTEQNILFKKNIEGTIGVPYELLIHDNRETKWGLCKIYNHYARISKYDILCFFHEDISFETINWGNIIIDFFNRHQKQALSASPGRPLKPKIFQVGVLTGKHAGKIYGSNPKTDVSKDVLQSL